MEDRRLYILVEGDDDDRLLNKIISSLVFERFDNIKTYKYSQQKAEKIDDFLKTIKSQQHWEYIFIADYDNSPCKAIKKQRLTEIFHELDANRIFIVVKEIEGWYLAGIDESCCRKMNIHYFDKTDNLSKEDFLRCLPKKITAYEFKLMIIKNYLLDQAKNRNTSLAYLINNFVPNKLDCELLLDENPG